LSEIEQAYLEASLAGPTGARAGQSLAEYLRAQQEDIQRKQETQARVEAIAQFVEVRIRIRERVGERYAVEISLADGKQFPTAYLPQMDELEIQLAGGPPEGPHFEGLLSEETSMAWQRTALESPRRRILLRVDAAELQTFPWSLWVRAGTRPTTPRPRDSPPGRIGLDTLLSLYGSRAPMESR